MGGWALFTLMRTKVTPYDAGFDRSLMIRISAASRSLFNAGSDWVGSCAITIKRRRDCTPKVQSPFCDSARCDWEIEEAALLPVVPTLALRQARSPREVQVLPSFQFFGHTPCGCLPLLRLRKSSHLTASRAVPLKRPSRKPRRRWVSGFRQATGLSSLTSEPPIVMASSSPDYFIIQISPRGCRA